MRCKAVWCKRDLGKEKKEGDVVVQEENPGVIVPRIENQIGFSVDWRLRILEACYDDGFAAGESNKERALKDCNTRGNDGKYKSYSICRSHFLPEDLIPCGAGATRVTIRPGAVPHRSALASNQQAKIDAVHNEATGRATRRRSYSAANSPVKRRRTTSPTGDDSAPVDPATLDKDGLLNLVAEYREKLDEAISAKEAAESASELSAAAKAEADTVFEKLRADLQVYRIYICIYIFCGMLEGGVCAR